MKAETVIITGANGFIGSNLCTYFCNQKFEVIALVRKESNIITISSLISERNFHLLNYDDAFLEAKLKAYENITLIHTAWNGVKATERNDWQLQSSNLEMGVKLLVLAQKLNVKLVLCLGSQAEYGVFSGRIDEQQPLLPVTAYGYFKVKLSEIWKHYCSIHNMNWMWVRLFSVYGKNEDASWFISNLIEKLKANTDVELTGCEQRYDYIFAADLAANLHAVIRSGKRASGFYHLGSNRSTALKDIAMLVKELTASAGKLLFGKLPYREGQIMHMEGNSEKFKHQFGLTLSDMKKNIQQMI